MQMKRKFNKGDIVASYVYGNYTGEWEVTGWEYDRSFREYSYSVKSTTDDFLTTDFQESCLDLADTG